MTKINDNLKRDLFHKHLLTSDQETIVALSTPQGSGAIAVLRLSGENAVIIADNISRLSSNKKLANLKSHTIHHGFVFAKETIQDIDEVLFFLMRGPRTFTGQDVVEISCHNNPFIIEAIINEAIFAGARAAKPGEFTQRAFLNGKIDLIQAESINDLINSHTELALRNSLSQLKGSLSSFISEIEQKIYYILALVEGSFEFFEEEQDDLNIHNMIKDHIIDILKQLYSLKANFNQQQQIKNGIKISLIGHVNVGKSTLFNAILNQDRAIVTTIAGTTRDVIESTLYKKGNFWQLTDTAGLRSTNNFIEKKGIDRSLEQAEVSDIILLVLDSSKFLSDDDLIIYNNIVAKHRKKIIFIANKNDINMNFDTDDLNKQFYAHFISVSGKNKIGIDLIEEEIQSRISKLFEGLNSPFLLNKRQFELVLELIDGFEFIKKEFLNGLEYEIIAHHIRNMLESISTLTGRNINEKLLDKVFRDFCVGK